jgi:hypothetical protein
MQELEEAKQYQWKKTENFGKIVEVKSSDDKMTYFTDGSSIFNEAVEEFLTEIVNGEVPYPGAGAASIGVQGNNLVEPTGEVNINNVSEKKVQAVASTESQNSAITTLIKKLSSKNIEAIDTKLNINIPKKNVTKMLIENSDDSREEIIDSIVSVAVEQIEINNLQEFLKEEITNFINKYYE